MLTPIVPGQDESADLAIREGLCLLAEVGIEFTGTEVSILSIDAWRDDCGWQWNSWSKVGSVPLAICDMKPRALLKYLRQEYLTEGSKGTVAIEDDGYNVVIMDKGTSRPLLAIVYGEAF